MTVTGQEVLKASFVLVGAHLLGTPEQLQAFQNAIDTDVASSGFSLNIGATANAQEAVHVLTVNRDRITLDLSPARSSITREYPTKEELGRLAEIAGLAVANSGTELRPQAFGYNVELVYLQDSELPASQYIAQRLFASDLPAVAESTVSGGAGTLSFVDGTTNWNFTIEPRFRDGKTEKVFLSLNMHREEKRMPSEHEIKDSLRRTWEEAMAFARRFDESENS